MSQLYAVLVGINKYTTVMPLNGCINDIKAVEAWLKKSYRKKGALNIRRLTDAESSVDLIPTKNNIIAAFDLFADAKDDDICLFYYCGHGANLIAPREFAYSDSVLQALVCLDFYGSNPAEPVKGALTDKELGFLIWKTMKDKPDVSFVAITDCCHSGTMTRDVEVFDGLTTAVRGLSTTFISPPLQEYYGFDTGTGYQLKDGKCSVQEGRHIHFAAAQNDEVAREVTPTSGDTHGAFTYAMLSLLDAELGLLSYEQLAGGIKGKIQNYFFNGSGPVQTPAITPSYNLPVLVKDNIFLSNKSAGQERTYVVQYSKQYGWCIKAGQLQNLSVGDEVTVDTDNDEPLSFTVRETYPDFSVIAAAAELGPLGGLFRGKVTGQLKNTCKFFFDGNIPSDLQRQIWNGQYKNAQGSEAVNFTGVELVTTGGYRPGQDFALSISNDNIILTGPGAQLTLAPTTNPSPDQVIALLEDLNTVASWNLLLHFDNQAATVAKPYQLHLQYSTDIDAGGYIMTAGQTNGSLNPITYLSNGSTEPAFKLGITNTGPEPLHITFAYLSVDYGIETNGFYMLDVQPGETKWMRFQDSDEINLSNTSAETVNEYLKICIAAIPGGIPLDNLYQAAADTRSIGSAKPALPPPGTYWGTETIGFTIQPK